MNKSEVYAGRPVIYWENVSNDNVRTAPCKKSIITSNIIDVDGVLSCMIEREEKPVSIKNLDTISPGSIMAAQLSGCEGLGNDAFKKATTNFFKDRGINIKITGDWKF